MKKFIDTDPRLSEFSQDQLRDMAVAIDLFMEEDRKAIAAYHRSSDLAVMFADEIEKITARVVRLESVYTQLVNAHARQEYQKRVASN